MTDFLRWRAKADAVVTAWRARLGYTPPLSAVVGVLAVAQHETRCGDAWPGEYNWGACTLGPLNALERAAVAHLTPVVKPYSAAIAVAAEAQEALRRIGCLGPIGFKMGVRVPYAYIHCDSKPVAGGQQPYFTWFAGFDSDASGAEYLIAMLCGTKNNRAAKQTLESGIGLNILAEDMYDAGYYTGFYLRDKSYPTPEGPQLGRRLNVQSYARKLLELEPGIRAALREQTPPTIKSGSRGEFVRQWQRKLGVKDDGIFGLATMLATRLYQVRHGLKADGIVGPRTWAKAGVFSIPAWAPKPLSSSKSDS